MYLKRLLRTVHVQAFAIIQPADADNDITRPPKVAEGGNPSRPFLETILEVMRRDQDLGILSII